MSKDKAKIWECVGTIDDPLTDLLRNGARALIQQAIEAELQAFLGEYAKVTDLRGRQTVVRNGYLPEREIVTGVGNVAVNVPKVRDRSGGGIKFNSSVLPPHVRKAKRVEAALPWLYLRGISTGDMQEALSVLLGDEAKGLSPAVVSRWLCKKHKVRGTGRTRYPDQYLYEQLGLINLPSRTHNFPWAKT